MKGKSQRANAGSGKGQKCQACGKLKFAMRADFSDTERLDLSEIIRAAHSRTILINKIHKYAGEVQNKQNEQIDHLRVSFNEIHKLRLKIESLIGAQSNLFIHTTSLLSSNKKNVPFAGHK